MLTLMFFLSLARAQTPVVRNVRAAPAAAMFEAYDQPVRFVPGAGVVFADFTLTYKGRESQNFVDDRPTRVTDTYSVVANAGESVQVVMVQSESGWPAVGFVLAKRKYSLRRLDDDHLLVHRK